MIFLFSFLAIFLTTYAQLIIRYRLNSDQISYSLTSLSLEALYYFMTDLWILSALTAFFSSFLCWSYVLNSNVNAAKVYPIVASLTILSVSLLNLVIFQDKIKPMDIMGGILIIAGIFILARQ